VLLNEEALQRQLLFTFLSFLFAELKETMKKPLVVVAASLAHSTGLPLREFVVQRKKEIQFLEEEKR